MKSILIIFLLAFSLCLEEEKLNGWEKCNSTQESDDINKAHEAIFTNYSKSVNDLKEGDIIYLTAYTQLVKGRNFRITFFDKKSEFPAIQEYTLNRPLPQEGDELTILEIKAYEKTDGFIKFDDPNFSEIEYQLYKFLKKNNINLLYISYAYPIKNTETIFYIINAKIKDNSKDEQNLFVMGFGIDSKKYEFCEKIK